MGSQKDSRSGYCSQGNFSINVWTDCNQKCEKKQMYIGSFPHVVVVNK